MRWLDIAFATKSAACSVEKLLAVQRVDSHSVAKLLPDVSAFLADSGVQEAITRGHEYQLSESARYFLDAHQRVLATGYTPSDEDVLRVQVRTTGCGKLQVCNGDSQFQVLDVGGLRSERRKWLSKVRDADVIFYMASLTEFAEPLFEEASANRMQESLSVFAETSGLPHLKDVPICLFLSKLDLLDGRLQTHADALRGLLDREPSSEALGADAAVALIKQRYADVCTRCSQVHMVNLLDKKQTRKALDQAIMLAMTVHRRRLIELSSLEDEAKRMEAGSFSKKFERTSSFTKRVARLRRSADEDG